MKRAAGYLPPDVEVPPSQPTTQGSVASSEGGSRSTEDEELDLQSMVYGMKSFVEKISSHQGAEFPWYDVTCWISC